MTEIQEKLFTLKDSEYRAFHAALIPNIDKETIIGVRTPALRAYAKELRGSAAADAFLRALPHVYYEENNLHGMLLSEIKDYETCVEELDRFLPFVDNWATCDLIRPKVFPRHPEKLIAEIRRWMASRETYTVRFGMEMLMTHFLDGNFREEYLAPVADLRSEEYYVRMMQAWFFATALAKQYEAAVVYIEQRRLEPWTHNKAIQKARESFRVSDERKAYLKTLKI